MIADDPENTRLLAIETSGARCCVALRVGGQKLSRVDATPRAHARRLLPLVEELLQAGGIALGELDGIVVGAGPGSFTGLRIGMAVAQGLATAAGLPLLCPSSLAAAALAEGRDRLETTVVVAVDARMDEVYLGAWGVGGSRGAPIERLADGVGKPDAAAGRIDALCDDLGADEPVVIVGDGADLLAARSERVRVLPRGGASVDAVALLELAASAPVEHWVPAGAAEPVYLRDESRWTRADRRPAG